MKISKVKKLVQDMADLYKERQLNKQLASNVRRGIIKDTSDAFEDLFGIMVGDLLGEDYQVLVSQTLSFLLPEDQWRPRKKPKKDGTQSVIKYANKETDILVIRKRDHNIVAVFDLKNDVGWTHVGWVKEARKVINMLTECEEISYKHKEYEEDTSISLSNKEEIFYGFVSLNLQNDHGKMVEYEKDADGLPIYVLNQHVHLNAYKRVSRKTIINKENVSTWIRLIDDIKTIK